jgi:hypothetical protein
MKTGSVKPLPWGRVIGANWMQWGTKHVTAQVMKVVVGDSTDAKYWARDIVGDDRLVVKIHLVTKDLNETFYIDYDDGKAIEHLTVKRGDPIGLKQIYAQYEIEDKTDVKRIYGFTQA